MSQMIEHMIYILGAFTLVLGGGLMGMGLLRLLLPAKILKKLENFHEN